MWEAGPSSSDPSDITDMQMVSLCQNSRGEAIKIC